VAVAPAAISTLPPWVSRRNLVIAGGALLLILMIAIAASSGGGGTEARRSPSLPSLRPPPMRSDLAVKGEKLLGDGDVNATIELLENETAKPEGAADPYAHLILGHARAAAGRDLEALAAYDRALEIDPRVGDDRLRANAEDRLGRKDKTIAVAALDVLGKLGSAGESAVAEQASRGKVKELRRRARELADDMGILKQVDLVSSYSLDLQQGSSCKERREAIPKLRALRDQRAIPSLKKARGRSGGFLGLEDINDCLDKDAKEAIEFLEAM
jgi:hypothetical protein